MARLPAQFPINLSEPQARRMSGAMRPMAFSKKQTGSKGKTDYGRKGNGGSKIRNPWGGPNMPWRNKRSSKVGSSTGKVAKPDASEAPQTKGYPRNQPSQWPVVPDYVNHTKTPSLSGVNANTSGRINASIEQAYKRAGYQ